MSPWHGYADRLDACLSQAKGITAVCADYVAQADHTGAGLTLDALYETLRACEELLRQVRQAAESWRQAVRTCREGRP